MKLVEIRIEDFGRLQNRVFSPGAGLNLIEGPNESGKSTLLAFLRFVLYGFPRRNGPDGEERDKRVSWTAHRAAGSVTLETETGAQYRVTRSYTLRGSVGRENPLETLSVTVLPDGAELPLGDKTPGEYFLGLPAELYMSSLSVSQADAARVASPGVGEAVGGLLFSGDSDMSAAGAFKILDAARRDLQHAKGRGGRVAALEDKCARLQTERSEAEEAAVKLQSLRAKLQADKEGAAAKRAQLAGFDAALERAEVDRVLEQFADWHRAEAEAAAARDKLQNVRVQVNLEGAIDEDSARRLQADLRDLARTNEELSRVTPDVARLSEGRVAPERAAIAATIRERGGAEPTRAFLEGLGDRRRVLRLLGVLMLIFAALAGGAAVLLSEWLLPIGGAAAGLVLLAAVFFLCAHHARKKQKEWYATFGVKNPKMLRTYLEQCLAEAEQNEKLEGDLAGAQFTLDELRHEHDRLIRTVSEGLAAYGGAPFTTVEDAVTEVGSLLAAARAARETVAAADSAALRAGGAAEALHRPLLGLDETALRTKQASLPPVTENAETLRRQRGYLQEEIAEIERRLGEAARAESALAATAGDPAALAGELTATETELRHARGRLAAITMAGEALEEAVNTLRRGVTPRLADDASQIFAVLTDHAYEGVRLGADFSVTLDAAGITLPLSRFSAGCRDAAYLSLRLALLRTLSDEQLPLFLDEALAGLDDTRAGAFLDVLRRYCDAGGQCLLFTCHTREAAYLAAHGADVTKIAL